MAPPFSPGQPLGCRLTASNTPLVFKWNPTSFICQIWSGSIWKPGECSGKSRGGPEEDNGTWMAPGAPILHVRSTGGVNIFCHLRPFNTCSHNMGRIWWSSATTASMSTRSCPNHRNENCGNKWRPLLVELQNMDFNQIKGLCRFDAYSGLPNFLFQYLLS